MEETFNVQRSTFNVKREVGRSGTVLARWAFPCRARRRGFTLIELLLVIAIIGVVSAVTVPNLVRSMQGNRLRAATRTVVMAGRYARSMSLLNQKEMDVRFDLAAGRVSISEATTGAPRLGQGGAPGMGGSERGQGFAMPPPGEAGAAGTAGGTADGSIVRELDRVRIESVELEQAEFATGPAKSGSVVRYRSNGTCTPYAVRLVDESGAAVTVRVDMLAGVETEPL